MSSFDLATMYTERITAQVSLLKGRYMFLGTTVPVASADPERKNPLVLNFVCADVRNVAGRSRVE